MTRAVSILPIPNLAKTCLKVSPGAIVYCASIGGGSKFFGSFSSSLGSPQDVISGISLFKKGLFCQPTPGSPGSDSDNFKSAAHRFPHILINKARPRPT